MARTYLQLVNDVLVRLREAPVSSVSQTSYSALIGALVNDAKREVEDAWQWSTLLDYLTFNCTANITSYETNTMLTRYAAPPLNAPNGANERARLWFDINESVPLLFNVTKDFENRLRYESTLQDKVLKTQMDNHPQTGQPPSVWQLVPSTFYFSAGMWNKAIVIYNPPNMAYTMQLYIVNPQDEFAANTEVLKVPSAPVVQKAYLYALYERGEELGETLTLTAQKVENTLADAISQDQAQQASNWQLVIPFGGQY